MAYAELRCRTHYSFLRGASGPLELIERAATLGLSALAITDRDGVYAIPKAYLATKKHPGVKLITGAELTVSAVPGAEDARRHLTLLARDRAGYALLCRLLTASHAEKPKGEAHLPWTELRKIADSRENGARGLFAFPWIWDERAPDADQARAFFLASAAVFDTWVPLPRWLDGRDDHRSRLAMRIDQVLREAFAGQARVSPGARTRIVATSDAHMHEPGRRRLQDALSAIREGVPLSSAGRRLFPNAERHLRPPAEMLRLYADFPGSPPEPIANGLAIAEACRFSPSELRYRYPSEWIPSGETAQGYLERLVREGAFRRYGAIVPSEVDRQLRHELKLVGELAFADYFLTIWEIVEFARGRGILCQGRGSAANSAICYCLGITAIDPVRMNLLFERFISAERGEPPDIDVDFEHERREEVIQHLYEKYGRDRAAMVSAVVTYQDRLARREMRKAQGLDPEPADRVRTGQPPRQAGGPVAKEARQTALGVGVAGYLFGAGGSGDGLGLPPPARAAPRESVHAERLAEELAAELHGFPRHLSIHSGGFTLSADPIIETVPVEPARMEGRTIVQWDKYDLDALGLLKVDVLALGMLTAIRKAMDTANARGPSAPLTLATIPAEDPETYEMIRQADTVGVFQIESRAQMNMSGRLLARTYYDLVIQIAIVRPGPIVGKMVHPYLKRRRGLEPPEIPHPALAPILARTLGVPLFQEQVMKMAVALAGFTAGEADELRRAIGAWRSSGEIERLGRKLMEGLLASGLSRDYVDRIFAQIRGFAEYGFPESHAASFALIAYASAWLKRHRPADFACALLNSQPLGFYSNHTIVDDAKRHGVRVLPVDPNESDWDSRLVEEEASGGEMTAAPAPAGSPAIRLGWRIVHGLARKDAEGAIAERRRRPFSCLSDFLSRTRLRPSVLEQLALGDAFLSFGCDQRHALWAILEGEAQRSARATPEQLPLFPIRVETGEGLFRGLSACDAIRADYSAFGLSARMHPMESLRAAWGESGRAPAPREAISFYRALKVTTADARALPHGRWFSVAGIAIVRQRPPTAGGVVFSTLEDEHGFLDLIFHGPIYERYRGLFRETALLVASGVIQRDARSVSLLVRRLERGLWPRNDEGPGILSGARAIPPYQAGPSAPQSP